MKYCRKGSKFAMPSCLCSRDMALWKEPAAMWSAATCERFSNQRCDAGTPGAGATNGPAPVPAEAAAAAATTSAGSSRSSISQPPSSSPPRPKSSSSPAAAPAPPPRSRSSSSPHPALSRAPSSSPPAAAAVVAPPLLPAAASARPLAARVSKKPLETVSNGQLSSFRIGVGGRNSLASPFMSGRSVRPWLMRSASSCSPCVAAAT
mmetsp:Transcript_19009/g.40938  ORF Transcript_19009/g.40938 Transcript_19009/m.40938 type:complete len:206 (-) Transcript_19009:2528-3145(-)